MPTDVPDRPDTGAAPRPPRRLWRWLGRGLLLTFLGLALLAGGLFLFLRTPGGEALLTRAVVEAVNGLDPGLRLELGELGGPLPGNLRLGGLRLADREGVWLELESARLEWSLGSLLPRAGVWSLRVDRLDVTGLRVWRAPALPPSPPSPPSEPAPLTLLPPWLRLEVAGLRVTDLSLGGALLGLPDGDLRGSGAATATVGTREADLRLESFTARLTPRGAVPHAADGTQAASGADSAVLRLALEARLADAAISVHLRGADGGLLPHLVPALKEVAPQGLTLDARLRAQMPLLPPAPAGPLEAELRGEVTVETAGTPDALPVRDAALAVALSWNGQRLALRDISLDLPGNDPQIRLRGGGGFDPQRGPGADLTATLGDLGLLGRVFGLPPTALGGSVAAAVRVGRGAAPDPWWKAATPETLPVADGPLRAAVTLSSPALTLPGGTVDQAHLAVEAEAASLRDGLPESLTGALRFTGRSLCGLGEARVTTDWQVEKLLTPAPAVALKGLVARLPGLRLDGQLRVALPEPGTTPASAAASTEAAWPLLDGALHLAVTDWQSLSRLARTPLGGGPASLRLEASAGVASAASARQRLALHWETRTLTLPGTLELASSRGDLRSTHLYGAVRRLLTLFAAPGAPLPPEKGADLDLSVALGAGNAGPATWNAATLHLGLDDAQARLAADVRGPVEAKVQGGCRFARRLAHLEVLEVRDAARGLGLRLTRPAAISLLRGVDLEALHLALSPGGTVTVQARFLPEALRLEASVADIPLEQVRRLPGLAGLPLYGGVLAARASLRGTPRSPAGSLDLTLTDLPVTPAPDAPKATLTVRGDLDRGGNGLHALRCTARTTGLGEGLTATATVPLRFAPSPSLPPDAPLTARVFWRGDVAPLWRLVPLPGRTLSGRGELRATVDGTVRAPRVDAGVFLADGAFVDRLEGLVLRDIRLEARYATHGPSLLRLAAGDGQGGTLAVDGSLTDLATRPRVAARGIVRNLRPLRRDDLAVQLSGTLDVSGPLSAPCIAGDITVDQGAFQILNSFGGGVTTLDDVTRSATGLVTTPCAPAPQKVRPAPPAAAKTARATRKSGKAAPAAQRAAPPAPAVPAATSDAGPRIRLTLRAPGRFLIRGKGLDSEWRVNLAIRGPLSDPRLVGSLAPVRGKFDLLGHSFAFGRGDISFNGASPPNPLLNLSLEYRGQQLTALIRVQGSARQPKLVLSSQPEVPRDEIMAQLLFGKNMSDLSHYEAIQTAAAVAQLLSGEASALNVLSNTRDMLGLEVLRVGSADDRRQQRNAPRDASQQGSVRTSESSQAPTLEAGKYVLDNVYVGVEQGADPGTGTTVRVTIDLLPNLSLEGRTSSESSGLGVNWKMDY